MPIRLCRHGREGMEAHYWDDQTGKTIPGPIKGFNREVMCLTHRLGPPPPLRKLRCNCNHNRADPSCSICKGEGWIGRDKK
jgi:hypothetical protein